MLMPDMHESFNSLSLLFVPFLFVSFSVSLFSTFFLPLHIRSSHSPPPPLNMFLSISLNLPTYLFICLTTSEFTMKFTCPSPLYIVLFPTFSFIHIFTFHSLYSRVRIVYISIYIRFLLCY